MAFPEFISSVAYTAGDYVWLDRTLFRFVENHPAGAWNGRDVQKVSAKHLINMLDEIQDEIDANDAEIAEKANVVVTSATGATATITDGTANNVEDLTVAITATQAGSGDPAPDNVRAISGWTGAKVMRTGKNLLNSADAEIGTAWNGGSATNRARLVIPFTASTQFTLSMNGTNNIDNIYVKATDVVPATDAGTSVTSFPYTSTTTASSAYIVIAFSKTGITQDDVDALKLQLELGSSATSFESYQGTSLTIPFGRTVYGGTLDVTTGLLTVTHAKYTVTSTDYKGLGAVGSNSTRIGVRINDTSYSTTSNTITGLLCNMLNPNASATNSDTYGICCLRYDSSGLWFLARTPSDLTDEADRLAWLVTNECEFTYPLAESLTYQLSPQELALLNGNNSVWADCGNVTISYKADTKGYVDAQVATLQALILEG